MISGSVRYGPVGALVLVWRKPGGSTIQNQAIPLPSGYLVPSVKSIDFISSIHPWHARKSYMYEEDRAKDNVTPRKMSNRP